MGETLQGTIVPQNIEMPTTRSIHTNRGEHITFRMISMRGYQKLSLSRSIRVFHSDFAYTVPISESWASWSWYPVATYTMISLHDSKKIHMPSEVTTYNFISLRFNSLTFVWYLPGFHYVWGRSSANWIRLCEISANHIEISQFFSSIIHIINLIAVPESSGLGKACLLAGIMT